MDLFFAYSTINRIELVAIRDRHGVGGNIRQSRHHVTTPIHVIGRSQLRTP